LVVHWGKWKNLMLFTTVETPSMLFTAASASDFNCLDLAYNTLVAFHLIREVGRIPSTTATSQAVANFIGYTFLVHIALLFLIPWPGG